MSEALAAPLDAPSTVTAGPTAGEMIRRAREAAGLHVAALAVALKVPVRKLEALESDRYDDAGDPVFVRALASSVCRNLKVDPRPVLERLPQSAAPRLVRDIDGINAPFRAPSDAAPPGWVDTLKRPVVLAVGALLIGALVILLLPLAQKDASVADATKAAVEPAPAPVVAPLPDTAASQLPAIVPVAASSSPSAAESAPAVAAASPASAGAATAAGMIVFRASAESWVEVTDAKGATALRKLLAPGESAGVSGVLPLQVKVGRADTTEVQVRGKPFDLRPVSRDNVARFEVK